MLVAAGFGLEILPNNVLVLHVPRTLGRNRDWIDWDDEILDFMYDDSGLLVTEWPFLL